MNVSLNKIMSLMTTAVLSASPGVAQFEGIVESRNMSTYERGAPEQFTMTMWITPEMVKIELTGTPANPGSVAIYRTDKRVVWMLNDAEKTYFEVRRDESGTGTKAPPPQMGEEKGTVRRSGKKRTILGYPCEQFFIVHPDMKTEIWGTAKLGYLTNTLSKALGEERGEGSVWNDEVAKLGIFPLIASTKVQGSVVESSEVVKIEVRKLSRDLFDIPPGYKKQAVRDLIEEPPAPDH